MTGVMGTFRIDVEVENPERPGTRLRVSGALVDTGSELSWFRASDLEQLGIQRRRLLQFPQATGAVIERWTGSGRVYAAGVSAVDEVVFAEPRDFIILGARSLEGLNVVVDPVSRQLVDAGPAPAAAA